MTFEEKTWIKTIKEFLSCDNITPDVELNNRETDFIKTLKEHYSLSDEQHDWLKKIYDKF